METILTNLITNSVTMLDGENIAGKMIQINLNQQPEKIHIDYFDSGLGLSSVYKQDPRLILEPFETDKVNVSGEKIGTGMGMWIINKTVSEYNGNVDLSRNQTEPAGFYISIEMPRNC
jgi:nitrogen fixation/metabolism regulation signal transduction histidine kinase